MLNTQAAQAYTDFDALAKLKNEAKNNTPDSIKEVAKQFESVFVGMMLKSMRQAKLADGIMDSSQSDFYRDMYDQQLSVHLAGEQGLGLAEVIAKQLSLHQTDYAIKKQGIADYERKLISNHSVAHAIDKPQENRPVISSAAEFVKQLRPYAEQAAKKLKLDADLLLSQAALETGWGKSVIQSSDGNSSYNLFNIKADRSWQGQQEKVTTLEFRQGVAIKEIAGFRTYSSYQESFDDYVDFIKSNPRYKTALTMTNQPEHYMRELQQAGYATDPDYADKVLGIYQRITNEATNTLAVNQSSPRGQ